MSAQDLAYLGELAGRTEQLWAALSATIAAVEADVAKTQVNVAEGASGARMLPPGVLQVRILACSSATAPWDLGQRPENQGPECSQPVKCVTKSHSISPLCLYMHWPVYSMMWMNFQDAEWMWRNPWTRQMYRGCRCCPC